MGYVLKQKYCDSAENPIEIHLTKTEERIGKKTIISLRKYSQICEEHAVIYTSTDGNLYIKDLKSLHGVFVNDIRVGTCLLSLKLGDNIGFGVRDADADGTKGIIFVLTESTVTDVQYSTHLHDKHQEVIDLTLSDDEMPSNKGTDSDTDVSVIAIVSYKNYIPFSLQKENPVTDLTIKKCASSLTCDSDINHQRTNNRQCPPEKQKYLEGNYGTFTFSRDKLHHSETVSSDATDVITNEKSIQVPSLSQEKGENFIKILSCSGADGKEEIASHSLLRDKENEHGTVELPTDSSQPNNKEISHRKKECQKLYPQICSYSLDDSYKSPVLTTSSSRNKRKHEKCSNKINAEELSSDSSHSNNKNEISSLHLNNKRQKYYPKTSSDSSDGRYKSSRRMRKHAKHCNEVSKNSSNNCDSEEIMSLQQSKKHKECTKASNSDSVHGNSKVKIRTRSLISKRLHNEPDHSLVIKHKEGVRVLGNESCLDLNSRTYGAFIEEKNSDVEDVTNGDRNIYKEIFGDSSESSSALGAGSSYNHREDKQSTPETVEAIREFLSRY